MGMNERSTWRFVGSKGSSWREPEFKERLVGELERAAFLDLENARLELVGEHIRAQLFLAHSA